MTESPSYGVPMRPHSTRDPGASRSVEIDPNFSNTAEFQPDRFIYEEMLRTVSDMARGMEPRTVTHALLQARSHGLSAARLMAVTGKSESDVELALVVLEEDGWVLSFEDNGFTKYIIRGAFK